MSDIEEPLRVMVARIEERTKSMAEDVRSLANSLATKESVKSMDMRVVALEDTQRWALRGAVTSLIMAIASLLGLKLPFH